MAQYDDIVAYGASCVANIYVDKRKVTRDEDESYKRSVGTLNERYTLIQCEGRVRPDGASGSKAHMSNNDVCSGLESNRSWTMSN